jgi:leukotriene-A4 hydrolase
MSKSIFLLFIIFMSCGQPHTQDSKADSTATVKDPHSYANPSIAIAKHVDLDLTVDFDKQQIAGKAVWTIDNISGGREIIFDNNALAVEKVTIGADEKQVNYKLDEADSILGQAFHIPIEAATKQVTIYYHTTAGATALQWLTPPQTAGKKLPFLFSQSESILARSWVPCQDGPGIRITYNATVHVPKNMMAVMSAVDNPQQKNDSGVYSFKQTHPIPSYLLALAVGDLQFKAVDNRTGVYAEPSVLEKATWEFTDMGKMVTAAEKLYGPYRWGRYDILVLPPSFPFGGMENPNLTFATPTVIAGDRSLVSLVAHELAHSWSGNLVTNATWDDMWLNEGFTVYFEKRIIEALYGKEEAKMQEVLSRNDLNDAIEEFGADNNDTKLKGNYAGRNPDDAISNIPYEKGYAFLRMLEENVGRAKLDSFLKSWFNSHAFQSQTTETFVTYLKVNLLQNDKALTDQLKVEEWIYQPGVPANIPPASSALFTDIDSSIKKFSYTKSVAGLSKKINSTNQLLYFLTHLPDTLSIADMTLLDSEFHFTQSNNAEVQCVWYTLAVEHHYKPAFNRIEQFLITVGRRKFLTPIYKQMIQTPEGKTWAKRIYEKAKVGYHPLAVKSIGNLVN